MDNPTPFFQSLGGRTSADAVKIREMLDGLEKGTTLTYSQISEAIGHDVQKDRSGLYKAQRELQREEGKIFTTIRGEGVRLAESEDGLEELERTTTQNRRKSVRTLKRVQHVDMSGLDQAQRIRATVLGTALHETAKALRAPALAKVRQRVIANGTQLGLPDNLED